MKKNADPEWQAVNLRMSKDLYYEVVEDAEREERTIAGTIRKALRFYLDAENRL